MDPVKLKLTIAYDGAGYAGWQTQASGLAVQEVVEKAIESVFGARHAIHGSSRTDAGVHARGMAAHLEIPRERFTMPLRKFCLAINAHLPPDVRVMAAKRVPGSFHARFGAKGKQYRYLVYTHLCHDPLLRGQAWLVTHKLDLPAMRAAAAHIVGKHDFAAFAGSRHEKRENTVRTVTTCDIRRAGRLFTFIIEGDGFLYRMCRSIVGTLVQVGLGKYSADEIPGMLAGKDRRLSGMSAPAHGLVLWKVFY